MRPEFQQHPATLPGSSRQRFASTRNKPLGLGGVMSLAGAAHSCDLTFGEELFKGSHRNLLPLSPFSEETELKISGAPSGGREAVEGAIPEH